ncbi:MAG: hypothetical protein EA409_11335 [Saprospirales bacterium]|nr:MAG: hypothetical protein EA409_11335 [Saprospirales bacterium]
MTARIVSFLSLIVIIWLGTPSTAFTQRDGSDMNDVFYDELTVLLSIENLGSYNMDAVYHEDNLFLPLVALFKLLEIHIRTSAEIDSFYGFFGDRELPFILDANSGLFSFREDTLMAVQGQDYILTFEDIFISLPIYKRLFGLHMDFSFRTLRVFLESEIEPPVIRILRVEKMRENLRIARGEVRVDTTIERDHKWIGGAVLDINLRTQQNSSGNNREVLKTDFGGELLGGEFHLSSFLERDFDFDLQRQYASWRFVNNDFSAVRQIELRTGIPNIHSRVFTNTAGIRITNTPTTLRRSFGTYLLRRTTHPNWEVELYVNNVLIDETKADAGGEFQFEVPLSYGSTDVTLRFYGPWGQEEVETETIEIPFILVPTNSVEYHLAAGFTLDEFGHRYMHGRLSYGLNRHLTLHAGYEYFERNLESRQMPFAGATFSPFQNTMFSYSFLANAWQEGSILIRAGKGLFINADVKIYEKEQDAQRTPNLKETRLSLSTPFILFDSRFMFRSTARSVENISGWAHFIDSNLGFFSGRFNLSFSSRFRMGTLNMANFALDARLFMGRNWSFSGNTWFDADEGELLYSRIQVQRRFSQNFTASANLNHSFQNNLTSINIAASVDLNFTRVSSGILLSKDSWQTDQNIFSSIQFGGKSQRVRAYSRSGLGRGTIDVLLFVDVNHNGIRDKGEPLVEEAIVSLSGGRETLHHIDSVSRFTGLELYTNYILNINESRLPNIAWRLDKEVYSIYPHPNQIKTILIPVKPVGEIEGRVILESKDGILERPLHNIRVNIRDSEGNQVERLSTDQMGYFLFLGLSPGIYSAELDLGQILGLNLSTDKPRLEFEIRPTEFGDFVPELDFSLFRVEE